MHPLTRPVCSLERTQKPEQLLPENVRVGSRLQRTLPRYVRVNTLKCTRAAALAALQVRPPQGCAARASGVD
jgi:hypothetical protein